MDYARIHAEEKDKNTKIIVLLNYVRFYKRMILPCELAEILDNCKTKEMGNELDKRYIN